MPLLRNHRLRRKTAARPAAGLSVRRTLPLPILPDGQITSDFRNRVKPLLQKYFYFRPDPNQRHIQTRPVPTRGALRDRHGRWVRDAVDVMVPLTKRRQSGP